MKNSPSILIADLPERLKELGVDVMLLEQDGRPTKFLKRSLEHLRRQAEAAGKAEREHGVYG
ncbi:hypothetical protein [Pararobbsia alpina]|uniref:Uncharacterized protein n=1 Tax=Pararobbsia alpina TaxID=621374 RepID=A0A6S7BNB1_9BURK|nr:hypothetical protein [Pararobbsia alpina]CAB3806846.1 hypothetical protein LMG28138_05855 [Pararobbsia alpina]